jgi:2'-5' RNA ligase
MQGVSFVEDLTPRDLEAVLSTAQEALSQIEPFTVRFDRPVIRPEAIVLAPDPVEPLSRLKQAIRQAIATAVGDDVSDADAPEYQPHVSFAYVSADQSPAAVLKAIDAVDTTPAELRIDTVPLIEMHRDNRMYEWRNLRTVQLGTSVPSAAESRPSTDVRQMSAN